MKTKNFILVSLMLLVMDFQLTACSSKPKDNFQVPETKSEKEAKEQVEMITNAENLLLEQNPKVALESFEAYLRKFPLSAYTAQAELGRGRSLEALGRCPEAIEVFRVVGEQGRVQSPMHAGMAYVGMANCYELAGDEARLQFALKDALSFAEKLPPEVRDIEIPVKQAASDLRRGLPDTAQKTLQKVERNLPQINSDAAPEVRKKQADLLYRMGNLDLNALGSENYLPLLDSFEALQNYLWRSSAMKAGEPSEAALSRLNQNYEKFANLAFNPPPSQKGLRKDVAERTRKDLQRRWIARLIESIQNLRNYSEDQIGKPETDLSRLLDQIEKSGDLILRRTAGQTPLTKGSQAPLTLPSPTPTSPQSANPQDPNLKTKETGTTESVVPENP